MCPGFVDIHTHGIGGATEVCRSHPPSHPIPSHPIPSHPIPSHPIPSHPIPSHPIPSHPIPSHPNISSLTIVLAFGILASRLHFQKASCIWYLYVFLYSTLLYSVLIYLILLHLFYSNLFYFILFHFISFDLSRYPGCTSVLATITYPKDFTVTQQAISFLLCSFFCFCFYLVLFLLLWFCFVVSFPLIRCK